MYVLLQGSRQLVVGATKRYGLTSQEAMHEAGRGACGVSNADERAAAAEQLLPRASRVWPPAVR
jgi:hypothetical protein